MAERTIVGVDFSGAGKDTDVGNTWVTIGIIETEDTDELKSGMAILDACKPVSREKLTEKLKALPDDAVAALDFPFSVPIAFAEFLGHSDGEMPVLWNAVAGQEQQEFIDQRDEFVKQQGELLRAGDLHVPGCYSCLHKSNPNMVPMTFQGMRLLGKLWEQTNCRVPPLEVEGHAGAVLLEVMPGAALEAYGLPNKGYKGGQDALDKRREILRGLCKKSGVNVLDLHAFRDEAMFADHALDSMVAAVAAARWVMDESDNAFRKPSSSHTVAGALAKYQGKRNISPDIDHLTQEQAARKEGWIYVPNPVQ